MIQTIKVKDLKVGMHVVLPASWFNHPFLRNQFTIKYRSEITKVIDGGFDEVNIDNSKGMPFEDFGSISHADADNLNEP